jgi:cephalosporin hydroxylase
MSVLARVGNFLSHPSDIPARVRWRLVLLGVGVNNFLAGLRSGATRHVSGSKALEEIKERALVPTDISDHLVTLFVESVSMAPRLIVELGVRGGESTFVMERVAALFGSTLVSVDIDECKTACTYERAVFVRSDDIAFAGRFPAWCRESGVDPRIDVLMIDTSHLYDHTAQEIECWFPLLSPRAMVFFHDTNLKPLVRRRDGSLGTAWDNERGVIRALERYFDTVFDEKQDFVDFRNGWLIKHHASCGGLTVLERVRWEAAS